LIKASSNRLVIGGAIAGGGATMIGGEFSAKILLNGKDNGKQEYINPDMMESLASCIECPPPPIRLWKQWSLQVEPLGIKGGCSKPMFLC
jgi:hypothetical protein